MHFYLLGTQPHAMYGKQKEHAAVMHFYLLGTQPHAMYGKQKEHAAVSTSVR